MHANAPKLHKLKIVLELENHTTATLNDTIKTVGIRRKSLRSTASCAFRDDSNPSHKSVSYAMYAINALCECSIGRPTLKEVE